MSTPLEEKDVTYVALASAALDTLLAVLKDMSQSPKITKYDRDILNLPFREKYKERCILGAFVEAQRKGDFVAIVSGRGFSGTTRTVLLKDIRVFGIKFVLEDHLWVRYDKMWRRIEPFLQGQKVILCGRPIAYTRQDGSNDFTVEGEKLVKL